MISLGMLAALSTWVLGPARGMQTAAEQELFPKIMAGKNRFGMPVNMLVIQILIVLVLSSVFLVMPSVYAAFCLIDCYYITVYGSYVDNGFCCSD